MGRYSTHTKEQRKLEIDREPLAAARHRCAIVDADIRVERMLTEIAAGGTTETGFVVASARDAEIWDRLAAQIAAIPKHPEVSGSAHADIAVAQARPWGKRMLLTPRTRMAEHRDAIPSSISGRSSTTADRAFGRRMTRASVSDRTDGAPSGPGIRRAAPPRSGRRRRDDPIRQPGR